MNSNRTIKILKKILRWALITIVALVVTVPVLIYIPFVQDIVKDVACRELSKSTGMEISLESFRLSFPLDITLKNLNVVDRNDTIIAARHAHAQVAVMPLFSKKVQINALSLDSGKYLMNNPDSAIYLRAHIDRFTSSGTGLGFDMKKIDVGKTMLDGADITLFLKDTTTVSKPDTTASEMFISTSDLTLRNVKFKMRMLPTIDTLNTFIGTAKLNDGRLDIGQSTIDVGILTVDSLTAAYFTPSAEFLRNYQKPNSSADSIVDQEQRTSTPFRINVGHIGIKGSEAIYATAGAVPAAGLDMDYLQVCNIDIEVDSFYNCGTAIRVPLTILQATERCGLSLTASGLFEMDSTTIKAEHFDITTPSSNILINAMMGMGNLTKDPDIPLSLRTNGQIALADIYSVMPTLAAMMKGVPAQKKLDIIANINGSSGSLDVSHLSLNMPGILGLNASGKVNSPMEFKRMNGKIKIDGSIRNIDFLKSQFLDKTMAKAVNIPQMDIAGDVNYNPGLIDGDIKITTSDGNMALDAQWSQKAEGYDLNLNTRSFPLQKFMPGLGISNLTADAKITGHGYDLTNRRSSVRADIDLAHADYHGQPLENISLTAALDTCRMTAHVISDNKPADFNADITAWFSRQGYEWDVSGDIRALDLKALGFSSTDMNGSTMLYTTGIYNPLNRNINAELSLNDLNWTIGEDYITIPDATTRFLTNDSLTYTDIDISNFKAEATAHCGLDTLMRRVDRVTSLISSFIEKKNIDIEQLQQTLPKMSVNITSGSDNGIARYLARSNNISFDGANLTFNNDSLISLQAEVVEFMSGSTRLDKINFNANQKSRILVYQLSVNNKPGTMDDFAHVDLSGYVSADKVMAYLKQSNIENRQGFSLGFNATISDSTLAVKLVPHTPTIAYKNWEINPDNFVVYSFDSRHLDANLKLMSDSCSLTLYTEHAESNPVDSLTHGQEDMILKLDNIRLSEWLSLSPFAPPVKGIVNANLRFRRDMTQLTGKGIVNVDDLYYGRERVGTFGLNLDVANDPKSGALRANAGLMIDGVKVITASGNLNDSTAVNPFLLDFSMIHFPLRVVNPFLPKNVAQLSGMLNGKMDITGDLANPVFNGFLDFDSTAVKLGITGTSYAFSEEKIPVDSNIVKFDNFSIAGLNGNDLHVNGIVDARKLSNVNIDLSLKARDMQLVNTNRPRGANVYGKAFIDLDAIVKGNMNLLRVDADLNLLAGTNVTYVMTEGVESLAPQSSDDMVHFVQFSDTTTIAKADSITPSPMAVLLDARLVISEGSTINVDLSADGKNKASISGTGSFTYNLTPMNDVGRITGRYTINSGFVRYTPQISTGGISMSIMSEKNFKFEEGSYIAFNGNLLNPILSIRAVDRLRANVTQSGHNSRLVNFDITVSISNTLENMNVAFNLSTTDDLTIENELQSMSPEQRANQAMNMLLYNQYTGTGTKANANLSGNPLYAFLASQLNSWAANNIRGVDISFGIDQYDTTTDGAKSTTTSYSYRVSKTLFNDRFKIVVGGNYSTDADADENFSQNLINDISFEYMLNRSGSMYVRLFRHVGYESILEGEITQTGVGFVIKRKLNNLRDLFRFSTRAKEPEPQLAPVKSSPSVEK